MLHARSGDPESIDLLKGVIPDQTRRYLGGQDDHRDRIHIGGSDTRYRIRDARA